MRAAVVGLGVLGAAAALGGCGGTKEMNDAVVPNLIGKDFPSAEKLLSQRGLRWRWEDGAKPLPSNAFLLADTIVGQTLAPGQRVKRGSVVVLVPSSSKLAVVSPLG